MVVTVRGDGSTAYTDRHEQPESDEGGPRYAFWGGFGLVTLPFYSGDHFGVGYNAGSAVGVVPTGVDMGYLG